MIWQNSNLLIFVIFIAATSCTKNSYEITPAPTIQIESQLNSVKEGNTPTKVSPTTVGATNSATHYDDKELDKLFNNIKQIESESLELSISAENSQCQKPGMMTFLPDAKVVYEPGEPMLIKTTFRNLTHNPINVAGYKAISYTTRLKSINNSELIPILKSLDGRRVIAVAVDDQIDQLIFPFHNYEIHAKSEFDTTFEYTLPTQIFYATETRKTNSIPIPPGRYLFRLFYLAYGDHNWNGVISSNQIEICVSQ